MTLSEKCVWLKLKENVTNNGLNKKEVCFSEIKSSGAQGSTIMSSGTQVAPMFLFHSP